MDDLAMWLRQVHDVLAGLWESYPEAFVAISLFLVGIVYLCTRKG